MYITADLEFRELLNSAAKKAGKSVSGLIKMLVEKHLSLIVNEGDDIPIIIRVPTHLKEDEEELKKWLSLKSEAIFKALTTN